MKINDEEINALSWTIVFLKSKLWLFNKKNGEAVKCLESLLNRMKEEQRKED